MPGRQTRALISAQQVLFPRPQAMMRSSPFSPRLALVFDFATRGRNCLARAFGYTKSLYSYCAVKFARQDNLSFANFFNRKSTRLNSSHVRISYAVFCLKKKKKEQ